VNRLAFLAPTGMLVSALFAEAMRDAFDHREGDRDDEDRDEGRREHAADHDRSKDLP
jgi:hypothetical protein